MIEERAEAVGFAALKHAATAMSAAYRESRAVHMPDPARTAAYLVAVKRVADTTALRGLYP